MSRYNWIPTAVNCTLKKGCWILPLLLWAMVVGWSLWGTVADIERHSFSIAREGARNMFRMAVITRLWNARHGGVYVPVTEVTEPNPFLTIPNRDVLTVDGLRLTMVNPAFMTRQISEIAADHGISFHITSLNPLRPANAADPWERQALLRFEKDEPEYAELLNSSSGSVFRYMAPLLVKPACMKCHAAQGYQVGDVRGGISVSFPSEPIFGSDRARIGKTILQHVGAFSLLAGLSFFFLLQVRRNWMELERVRSRQAQLIDDRTSHLEDVNARLREEIKDRKLAEQKYRSVSMAAYDAIVSADQDGHISSWNSGAERIFGYTERQVLGRPVAMLMPARYRADHQAAYHRAAVDGDFALAGQTLEMSGLRSNGDEFPLELSLGSWDIDGRRHFTAVVRDVSERKASEQSLRLAATVFSSTAEGLIIADRDERIVSVNPAFSEITGYSAADILGRKPSVLKSGRHDGEFYRRMWASINGSGTWSGEIWNRRKDGSVFPEWLSISAVKGEDGVVTHFIAAFTDISELKASQDQLDHIAHHDVLTDLPNRRLFMDRLEHALVRARRGKAQLAVLFMDLDHFKTVNDSLGHAVGDALLQRVAERFCRALRDEDTVARLGGDEFTVLLEDIGGTQDAVVVAQKLLGAFEAPIEVKGNTLFVTPSIGISLFPNDGQSAEELLKDADSAMYKAKEQGRNGYHFYSQELTSLAVERLELETSLRRALDRDELRVFYQPKICLRTGKVVGVEALVRWQHPQLGIVSPARFVPLAEENGMISPIGAWVLETACRQGVQWARQGVDLGCISVNVAGAQIQNPGFPATVADALRSSGLPPDRLELEITEGFIMRQAERAIRALDALRQLGLKMAIDDFGTGYSSLSYLKRLPIDTLKIDKSFVLDLPGDLHDVAITKAVIALGRSMHLTVVAEGVETPAQERLLQGEGCDQAQGFMYSRPIPPDEIPAVFRARNDPKGRGR